MDKNPFDLPTEVVQFLADKRELEYDARATEAGIVRLNRLGKKKGGKKKGVRMIFLLFPGGMHRDITHLSALSSVDPDFAA